MNKDKQEKILIDIEKSSKSTIDIPKDLFDKWQVKRGLRNEDNTGVLVGISRVGNVIGYDKTDGVVTPIPGKLLYRGLDLVDLVKGIQKEDRLGFEEVCYLLLSSALPNKEQLEDFTKLLVNNMPLEKEITLHLLAISGNNIMNVLARGVLSLYNFDENPDDTSIENLIKQAVLLISKFPTVVAYAYNVLRHDKADRTLHIRHPNKGSIAENLIYLIKGNDYSPLEVKILDLALILHAEHSGGNNSTFAVRVVSSSQTDTYSAIATGISSLNGPLHGGANLMVNKMLDNIMENVKDWDDQQELDDYLEAMIKGEVFDKTGLIYGIGHAVYTVSDPRAILLKDLAAELAKEKGIEKEYNFLRKIEDRALETFMRIKGGKKKVCINVDFYSGFVYKVIGIPNEVYTPLFAISRVVGWMAHRIEELHTSRRIIRPAYKNIEDLHDFIPLDQRK